jgi:hypothetical protein
MPAEKNANGVEKPAQQISPGFFMKVSAKSSLQKYASAGNKIYRVVTMKYRK